MVKDRGSGRHIRLVLQQRKFCMACFKGEMYEESDPALAAMWHGLCRGADGASGTDMWVCECPDGSHRRNHGR